jgi:hypothetical protein
VSEEGDDAVSAEVCRSEPAVTRVDDGICESDGETIDASLQVTERKHAARNMVRKVA